MKLIPTSTRVRNDDQVGRGMEAVFTLALFLGIGYLLDHWLGTAPIFMIALVVLAAVGLFASFKYRYDATMERLEDERRERGASRSRSAR